jgi:hypothetical protein
MISYTIQKESMTYLEFAVHFRVVFMKTKPREERMQLMACDKKWIPGHIGHVFGALIPHVRRIIVPPFFVVEGPTDPIQDTMESKGFDERILPHFVEAFVSVIDKRAALVDVLLVTTHVLIGQKVATFVDHEIPSQLIRSEYGSGVIDDSNESPYDRLK